MHIRRARADEAPELTALWERSARAMHHFLSDSDIRTLKPLVAEELASSELLRC